MRREQLLALFTVLGACGALQVSEEQSRRHIVGQSVVLCGMRGNSSNSAFVRQLVKLKAELNAVEKIFRKNDDLAIQSSQNEDLEDKKPGLNKFELNFFQWLAPHYNTIIGSFYTFSFSCDLLIAIAQTMSIEAGVAGSTSVYTVLNSDDSACRDKFSLAMRDPTSDNFKKAAKCIQDDMDKCVPTAQAFDLVVTWLSMLQNIVNTLMSALEFRHSNFQTKIEVQESEANDEASDKTLGSMIVKINGQIGNLQSLLCSSDVFNTQAKCQDKDMKDSTETQMENLQDKLEQPPKNDK